MKISERLDKYHAYLCEVQRTLLDGYHQYGDEGAMAMPVDAQLQEVAEEAVDITGWLFFPHERVSALIAKYPNKPELKKIKRKMELLAAQAAKMWNEIQDLREEWLKTELAHDAHEALVDIPYEKDEHFQKYYIAENGGVYGPKGEELTLSVRMNHT
ncbi:MAG: hypothetical protein ACYTEO_17010 [Planctomycetota bacterium]